VARHKRYRYGVVYWRGEEVVCLEEVLGGKVEFVGEIDVIGGFIWVWKGL